MTNQKEVEQVEIKILEWDEYSKQFTIKGDIPAELDRLIKGLVRIQLLVLKEENGNIVAEIRNVRLKASQWHCHELRDKTSTIKMPIQTTDFEYEEL